MISVIFEKRLCLALKIKLFVLLNNNVIRYGLTLLREQWSWTCDLSCSPRVCEAGLFLSPCRMLLALSVFSHEYAVEAATGCHPSGGQELSSHVLKITPSSVLAWTVLTG